MPGLENKHVHFADAAVSHTFPGTPSPCFSDVSLPSTGGPPTPPSYTGALPLLAPAAPLLHPALAYQPGRALPLRVDVAAHPSLAALDPAHAPPAHLRNLLAEPATHPPCAALRLVSDLLPYAIVVHPGSAAGARSPHTPLIVPLPSLAPGGAAHRAGPHVTVSDVLVALYNFLRIPLAPAEFDALPRAQRDAVAGGGPPPGPGPPDPARERSKGAKRVDLLLAAGRTRLAGLSATKGGTVWVLNLG